MKEDYNGLTIGINEQRATYNRTPSPASQTSQHTTVSAASMSA